MAFYRTEDNCNLYYEEYGQGEPLVFIHGWACHHGFFKYQIQEFQKKYHVIVYDLRGHGKSDRGENTEKGMNLTRFAKDLHGLLEYLKLDSVYIAGWSMGTSTLLSYIREYGCQYLKKICFIDMTPKLLNDSQWKLGQGGNYTMEMNLKYMSLIASNWDVAAKLGVPGNFSKGYPKEDPLFQWVQEQMLQNTPHCMMNMWVSMAVEDFRPVLGQISVPVLLAYSGDGVLYSPAHGEYMRQQISDSKLVIFEKCGHGLFLEDPIRFNAELAAFLESENQ